MDLVHVPDIGRLRFRRNLLFVALLLSLSSTILNELQRTDLIMVLALSFALLTMIACGMANMELTGKAISTIAAALLSAFFYVNIVIVIYLIVRLNKALRQGAVKSL